MTIWIALAGALAGAAPAQEAPAPAPRLERIEMVTQSWGRPVSRWWIDASGKGEQVRPAPDVFNAGTLVTRGFDAGTAGFRRVRVMLGRAEARGGVPLPCINRITDAPYGEIRWTRADGQVQTQRFDTGCRDFGARQSLDERARAEALVVGWADAGPVVKTEPAEEGK
ncbi:hypothetical protein ACG3SL_18830 [Sphingomonas sp. CJ20]